MADFEPARRLPARTADGLRPALLPMLLRDPPIYETLREHSPRLEKQIKQR